MNLNREIWKKKKQFLHPFFEKGNFKKIGR